MTIETIATLRAENALLRQECERLHIALDLALTAQRIGLDGWAAAWDAYRVLVDECHELRLELDRLRTQTPAKEQGQTTGTWMSDHDD
jgi:hypothetical protein